MPKASTPPVLPVFVPAVPTPVVPAVPKPFSGPAVPKPFSGPAVPKPFSVPSVPKPNPPLSFLSCNPPPGLHFTGKVEGVGDSEGEFDKALTLEVAELKRLKRKLKREKLLRELDDAEPEVGRKSRVADTLKFPAWPSIFELPNYKRSCRDDVNIASACETDKALIWYLQCESKSVTFDELADSSAFPKLDRLIVAAASKVIKDHGGALAGKVGRLKDGAAEKLLFLCT